MPDAVEEDNRRRHRPWTPPDSSVLLREELVVAVGRNNHSHGVVAEEGWAEVVGLAGEIASTVKQVCPFKPIGLFWTNLN